MINHVHYKADFETIESPFMSIIADIVKNNKELTPELQNVIAKYLDCQVSPPLMITRPFDTNQ